MRIIIQIIFAISFISCNPAGSAPEIKSEPIKEIKKSENFDWLLGNWKRLNETSGKQTFESWNKTTDSEYLGFGFTLQKGDTIWQEKMNLIHSDGKWCLKISSPSEKEPTVFEETTHSESEFTFKNDSIEFPNEIKYWISNELLHAKVSSPEMAIEFEFEKIK